MAFSKAAKEAQQMQDNLQLVAELEIEMMSDMYNRMIAGCQRKCIPPKYKDSELSKAEAVCVDRCVAKYMEVHERVGRKLTEMSMQDTALLKSTTEAAKN